MAQCIKKITQGDINDNIWSTKLTIYFMCTADLISSLEPIIYLWILLVVRWLIFEKPDSHFIKTRFVLISLLILPIAIKFEMLRNWKIEVSIRCVRKFRSLTSIMGLWCKFWVEYPISGQTGFTEPFYKEIFEWSFQALERTYLNLKEITSSTPLHLFMQSPLNRETFNILYHL